MSFTLGYFNINGEEIDLITLSILETSSKRFSSRTISISGIIILNILIKLYLIFNNIIIYNNF